MAVLGYGGRLRLKREAPEPTVVRSGNVHVASNSIYMRNPAFWSGDQVTLSCIRGLPIDTSNNGPDCPDGHASYYGSDWKLGSNRDHITSESAAFYANNNQDQFYMREDECGLTTSINYYIYRDQLDRLSFYTTRAHALNGSTTNRVTLYDVDFGGLIVSATGTNAGSEGILWSVQCELTNWTLNLNSPEVDTTSVGERFGESVKSVITGGGTIDFLIDRTAVEGESDSTYLMQLLLMSEKGSKADAEFWMIQDSPASPSNNLLPGGLYYKTSLLTTSIAINVRASDLIAGSMNFVTVGEIALKMGTN